ncbi:MULTISPECIES: hypothetical protein [Phaeobacter]|uniref:Uncharacterized protein n=1 Tax=Phaeobacter piscinae TaxID=1580596 RepID=A0ABN5D9R1_9RHOB|nr:MULTISPECIES: hypothetical protein [Phaeobacter]ATG34297.1 hypothetical protein PhaeoP36_00122 [Phaeobacter piscinae]ATG38257.1 hypothetical protein PhaeoP14_00122 [Phaeobacter piscinae]AUQ84817.1 hypothetical protein PhaeoP42_00122 [Phaeobacter piscinae]AUR22701.1 hypothetical protein PhaeoP23_00122 [Phaeobacter piscinae]KII18539.1 hypothetical protein OO25_01020 [Phaeobacter sp. S60]
MSTMWNSIFRKTAVVAAALTVMSVCAGMLPAQSINNNIKSQLDQFVRRGTEVRFEGYLTGYSYWDNTPPGSAAIARPVLRRQAGGTGTYNDPVTIAVGHAIRRGRQTLDFPAGTRFYIERLRKYAIVEDVCGDGHQPQNGPCHTGKNGRPWLDIYIGGKRNSVRDTERCMNRLTGMQPIRLNPRRGYPVARGEISASGCQVFGPVS